MRFFVFLAFIILLAHPVIAANDWPQYRYNETHQGLVPASSNSEFGPFTQNWWNNITIPGPPSSAAVREGLVYYGDVNGVLWAFDQESGGVVWSNKTSANPIFGVPAVGQDFVYVMNKGGNLYSFNRKTGQAQTGYPVTVGATDAAILFHENEDLLYLANDAGVVQAYSALGKYKKWTFTASGSGANFHNATCSGGGIKGTPVVFESMVMFGSTNKCFFAIDKTSFGTVTKPTWVFQAKDSIRSTPVIDIANKKVVFADQSGNLYSLTVAATGAVTSSPIYTEPTVGGLSSEIIAGPVLADAKLVFAARNGFVRALPLTGGTTPLWSQDLHGQVSSGPAIANSHILVGSFDRNMYMLKLSDGSIADKRLAAGEIESSPAISGTQGFWASKDGALYSFGGTKPQRADLAVLNLKAPGATVGQDSKVTATIKNQGTIASAPAVAQLFAGAKLVSETTIAALEPGASIAYSESFTPSAVGKLNVRLFVDSDRTVKESDESNNDVTISATVAEAPPPADANPTTSEEGIPGFEVLFAFLAIGAFVLARRRSR